MSIDNNLKNYCKNGYYDEVKGLLETKPDIDILNYEYAFRSACLKGYFNIVDLLLTTKPTINISACNEFAFKKSCKNGFLDVAKKLFKLNYIFNLKINLKLYKDNC